MHGFVSYRRFWKVRSLCSDRAWLELGRYVAIELGLCMVRWPYLSLSVADLDMLSLPPDNRYLAVRLRLEQDFTARLFLKILFTKNNFRKKCSRFCVDLDIDSVVTDFDPNRCLILSPEMLETSALGLGQDLGLITALGGAMTTSTYVYRIVFDLIPSRFKVRDMFSAYVTCMTPVSFPPASRRTPTLGSPIRELSRSPLEGIPSSVPGTELPSKKWKTSDKENLPYFRIWKSLT
ncbi:hypothetical protein F2Q68_00017393 [Brassica cretica]|uniref:Uncharacterized protein n=1 Tax=Brassica cretica TaxID=69181 RepID=A0A8S9HB23_BRACR|nr:hypothetical protein F2Q68_00017393 [Brassica cretica]